MTSEGFDSGIKNSLNSLTSRRAFFFSPKCYWKSVVHSKIVQATVGVQERASKASKYEVPADMDLSLLCICCVNRYTTHAHSLASPMNQQNRTRRIITNVLMLITCTKVSIFNTRFFKWNFSCKNTFNFNFFLFFIFATILTSFFSVLLWSNL